MESTTLEARITNPALAVPGAIDALQALNKAISRVRISPGLLELMHLRASQINGCGVCAVQHPKIARKLGETDDRIFAVAAWRDAPFFTDAERAALALTDTPPVVPAKLSGLDLGPACSQCGGMMQRTGSCYTCASCGNNTGCG